MTAARGEAKRANRLLLAVFIALIIVLIPLLYLLYQKKTAVRISYGRLFLEKPVALNALAARISPGRIKAGEKLAAKHCRTCHLVPSPDVLPRRTWVPVLKNMAARMGLARDLKRLMEEERGLLEDLKRHKMLPSAPALTPGEFHDIAMYYYARSPEKPRPQGKREAPTMVSGSSSPFRVRRVLRENPDARKDLTLVRIDTRSRRILVGAMATAIAGTGTGAPGGGTMASKSGLEEYDYRLRLLKTVNFDSPPVQMRIGEKTKLITTLGGPGFGPGRVLLSRVPGEPLPGGRGTFGEYFTVLQKPYRLVHASYADLNGDGEKDLTIAGFGFNGGALFWRKGPLAQGNGPLEGNTTDLATRSGAIRTDVRDWDGDGRPDILALMAQAREGIYLYRNQGGGRFRAMSVIEKDPAHGLTHMEIVDLDKDGKFDIVTVNGDNGDLPDRPLKYYHGVRVYMNRTIDRSKPRFTETWFYPLHGAFHVRARDFDGDGDQDLVVIALYDDARRKSRENFVYFKNVGTPLAPSFRPILIAGLEKVAPGVMDVGDLDGDGDLDIVLGSLRYMSNPALTEQDRRGGAGRKGRDAPPLLVVLENRAR